MPQFAKPHSATVQPSRTSMAFAEPGRVRKYPHDSSDSEHYIQSGALHMLDCME